MKGSFSQIQSLVCICTSADSMFSYTATRTTQFVYQLFYSINQSLLIPFVSYVHSYMAENES